MKILMFAVCLLVFWFSSSHAWGQNCKPDVSGQDKISKQQVDTWFKTVSTSGVAITVFVGGTSSASWVTVQIDKQEAAATTNTEFQSPLRAIKGNQIYFGLKNNEPVKFVATSVSNEAKVSGSFMAGFSGKNLYTKVVLSAVVRDKNLAALRDTLTRKPIDAVRIVLEGDVVIQASVSDKDGIRLMEKFSCFYESLDKKGIDLLAAGPQPVPPSDASITGKYTRKTKASDYIELKPDGTFSLQYEEESYGGSYNVQANTITVHLSSRQVGKAQVSGNSLTFTDGNVYEKQAGPQNQATELTIDHIIQMVAAKLPDDVIIATIQKSGSKFDLTPNTLIKLKTAGVSDAVLRAMVQ